MPELPPGEFRPLPREERIGREEIERLAARMAEDGMPLGPRTQEAMAGWLAAILCGYRLELLTGRSLFKK